MTSSPDSDYAGAKAALSGFRRQALYTLHLLLTELETDTIIHPEGQEDVSVKIKGEVHRAIQVKAYSNNLALSHLKPKKDLSFLRRAAQRAQPNCVYELVSFGPLGEELSGIQEKDKRKTELLKNRLKDDHGYTEEEATVLDRIVITSADESTLQAEIDAYLSKTLTVGNPARAFELLTSWIYQAAENRLELKLSHLQTKLAEIGKYFAEREAHHTEWNTTIQPLESVAPTLDQAQVLEKEYYRGTAARYSHICAELDIPRKSLLDRINRAFSAKRLVVLHGLSGQGKTSLALRFLHDYVPETWRFWVRSIDNRAHAYRIANAISDHLQTFNATAYLFIDVTHKDLDWPALAKELLDKPNVKLLVAIREEDLARQTVSDQELGFPEDIQLEFTENEAETIYSQLLVRGTTQNAYPTFSEAWDRFGGKGPLLEFVYLITQTDSLRSVLQAQVARLHADVRANQLDGKALDFLNVCAVATAYEARVLARPLVQHLGLRDPVGTLQLFEAEYLIRYSEDKTLVEAVHPVRSELLAQILDDPTFFPRADTLVAALPFIPEIDLEVYLLHAFSRNLELEKDLLKGVSQQAPLTWSGAAGIGRALLWAGIRNYINQNKHVFDEVAKLSEKAWVVLLPDPANAMGEDIFGGVIDLIEKQNPERGAEIRRIRSGLSDAKEIFRYLRDWISSLALNTAPSTLSDWEGLAELTFWSGHLGIDLAGYRHLCDMPAADLPLETLGRACTGLNTYDPAAYSDYDSASGAILKERIRKLWNIFKLEEDTVEASITAHFIVTSELSAEKKPFHQDFNTIPSPMQTSLTQDVSIRGSSNQPESESQDSQLNREAVYRASLLRAIFPDRATYGTQGYGHKLSLLGWELPADSTVKHMPRKNLPIPWLVRVNSIYVNLVEFPMRPPTWRDYAKLILDLRHTVISALERLERSLSRYFEGSKPKAIMGINGLQEAWTAALEATSVVSRIPASAVDEWGFSGDGTEQSILSNVGYTPAGLATIFTIRRNRPLSKALFDYVASANNFFQHAWSVCYCHGALGKSIIKDNTALLEGFAKLGYSEHKVLLSITTLFTFMEKLLGFQERFDERLAKLVDPERVASISQRERRMFPSLWALWFLFAKSPERQITFAETRALSEFEAERDKFLEKLRQELSNLGDANSKDFAEMVFEGDRAHRFMVIGLRIANILQLESSRQLLFSAIDRAFANTEVGTLPSFALDYFWPKIFIVPMLHGVSMGNLGYILHTFTFSASGNSSCDRPWTRLRQPITEVDFSTYGLEIGESARASEELNQLETSFDEIASLLSHVSQFAEAGDLDELGLTVLQEYFTSLTPVLQNGIKNVADLLPGIISEFQAEFEDDPIAFVLIGRLRDLVEELESYTGTLSFGPDTAGSESQKYLEASAFLFMLKWAQVEDFELASDEEIAGPQV